MNYNCVKSEESNGTLMDLTTQQVFNLQHVDILSFDTRELFKGFMETIITDYSAIIGTETFKQLKNNRAYELRTEGGITEWVELVKSVTYNVNIKSGLDYMIKLHVIENNMEVLAKVC